LSRTVEVAWVIEHPKILEYLLNLDHPRGGSKAKYLLRFGFSLDAPGVLANALVDHAMANLPGIIKQAQQGPHRIVFEGTVRAPDGRDMPLRTVWMAREYPPEMRFVTAYPLKL
jgi:hypothetical protein